jgi:vacuolar-type H+-ATPase subunit H
MDNLIDRLHETFDALEARVKELFHDAAPEVHDTVTQVVGDAKQQATDLATQALADAEKDAKTVAAGASDVLETVNPADNTVETDQADGSEHDVPTTDDTGAVPVSDQPISPVVTPAQASA